MFRVTLRKTLCYSVVKQNHRHIGREIHKDLILM